MIYRTSKYWQICKCEPQDVANCRTTVLLLSKPHSSLCTSGSKFREVVKAIGDKIVVFDPPDDGQDGLKSIFTSQRNKDLKFSFDHVFGQESSQLDVYRCTTATILDDVLNGYVHVFHQVDFLKWQFDGTIFIHCHRLLTSTTNVSYTKNVLKMLGKCSLV